jgi:hypothetical protein
MAQVAPVAQTMDRGAHPQTPSEVRWGVTMPEWKRPPPSELPEHLSAKVGAPSKYLFRGTCDTPPGMLPHPKRLGVRL